MITGEPSCSAEDTITLFGQCWRSKTLMRLAPALLPFLRQSADGEQPNVLLILVDGLPAWILGCYGNREERPPNIDRLAQTGTRFLNHYACAPVAGKARAALLTGRTTMQLEDAGEVTLENLLGGIGYACGTSAGVTEAAGFLGAQSAAKPFFLTAALAPYANLPDAGTYAQEAAAKSAARGKEMLGASLLDNLRRVAAATTALDVAIGALVAKITQKKLLDNTLIVFTSPCGSLFGRHGLWASGDASDPVNMFEEAIASPMVWSWAGHVVPLATRPEMVSAYDLVPTICDITPGPTAGAQSVRAQLSGAGQRQAASQEAAVADYRIRAVRRYGDGAQRSLQADRAQRRERNRGAIRR